MLLAVDAYRVAQQRTVYFRRAIKVDTKIEIRKCVDVDRVFPKDIKGAEPYK